MVSIDLENLGRKNKFNIGVGCWSSVKYNIFFISIFKELKYSVHQSLRYRLYSCTSSFPPWQDSISKILVDKTDTPTAISLLEEIEEDRLLAEGGIFPIGKLQFLSATKTESETEFFLFVTNISSFLFHE